MSPKNFLRLLRRSKVARRTVVYAVSFVLMLIMGIQQTSVETLNYTTASVLPPPEAPLESHARVTVFYKYMSPGYGDYFRTGMSEDPVESFKALTVVHCPFGAVIKGPVSSSAPVSGLYDGPSHYFCEMNGLVVEPVPGPEEGRGMPTI